LNYAANSKLMYLPERIKLKSGRIMYNIATQQECTNMEEFLNINYLNKFALDKYRCVLTIHMGIE